jgi:hypothetical protein
MAITLHVNGTILLNTASLNSDGSVNDNPELYGYSGDDISIAEIIDQKPAVGVPGFDYTFDDINTITGSWNFYSASLVDGLQDEMISESNISQSHFGEVYVFRVTTTEPTLYEDEDYDTGHYKKYRNYEDGVLMESLLIPVTQSNAGYTIPPWE